jgi:flavorubredoxin
MRKTAPSRLEASLKKIHDEHGPLTPEYKSEAAQRYEAWCNSEEYKKRFQK